MGKHYRVAKSEVGDKMIVGARRWDNEIKERISLRREMCKVIKGREDL